MTFYAPEIRTVCHTPKPTELTSSLQHFRTSTHIIYISRFIKGGCSVVEAGCGDLYDVDILVHYIMLPPSTAPTSHCTPPVMNTQYHRLNGYPKSERGQATDPNVLWTTIYRSDLNSRAASAGALRRCDRPLFFALYMYTYMCTYTHMYIGMCVYIYIYIYIYILLASRHGLDTCGS